MFKKKGDLKKLKRDCKKRTCWLEVEKEVMHRTALYGGLNAKINSSLLAEKTSRVSGECKDLSRLPVTNGL